MKTISNFYEQTILECINFEGYDLPENQSDFEKIINVHKIFTTEYGGQTNLFCEWLQGLPSCLNIPFMNYEILENGKNAGYSLNTEYRINTFLDNYFKELTATFFNLYDQENR